MLSAREFRRWNFALYFLEVPLRTGVSNLYWMRLQDTFPLLWMQIPPRLQILKVVKN